MQKITITHVDRGDGALFVQFSEGTVTQFATEFLYEHRDIPPNVVLDVDSRPEYKAVRAPTTG